MNDHPLTMTHIKQLVKELTGHANVLAVPRAFVRFAGDHETALFLTQVIYWSERTSDPEGWFYKTDDEWDEELCLSSYQVRRAAERLKDLGVEKAVRKIPGQQGPKSHYRINAEVFYPLFLHHLEIEGSRNSRTLKNENVEIQEPSTTLVIQEPSKTLRKQKTTAKTTGGDAASAAPPPAAQAKASTTKHALPEGFTLTDEMRAWGARETPGVDLDLETAALIDWARSKRERKDDWIATWRNWMRREYKKLLEEQRRARRYQHPTNGPRPPMSDEDEAIALFADRNGLPLDEARREWRKVRAAR